MDHELIIWGEGEAEPAEEFGEVGVDHGRVVLAEPAAGLAGGKAEDGGADQTFGGARTHQLLLAVLGAAQRGSRREVARELRDAALGRGSYRGSREELTPGRRDPLGPLPVAVTALATLIRPGAWQHFTGGSTGAYSLTPAAWRQIRQAAGGGPGAVTPGPPSGLVSRCR